MSDNRFTLSSLPTSDTVTRPFGADFTEHFDARDAYGARHVDPDWSVIDAGGHRVARTVKGKTEVVTTLGDAETANTVRDLAAALVTAFPTQLHGLGRAAAGTPIDLVRLSRHIWETGEDPWNLPDAATGKLAALARISHGLPDPVRATLGKHVLEPWTMFGPVLVPATGSWSDAWNGHDNTFDISEALHEARDDDLLEFVTSVVNEVPADGFEEASNADGTYRYSPQLVLDGVFVAESTDVLDAEVRKIFDVYDQESGVDIYLDPAGRAALRAWITLHRPAVAEELTEIDGVDDLFAPPPVTAA